MAPAAVSSYICRICSSKQVECGLAHPLPELQPEESFCLLSAGKETGTKCYLAFGYLYLKEHRDVIWVLMFLFLLTMLHRYLNSALCHVGNFLEFCSFVTVLQIGKLTERALKYCVELLKS